MSYRTSANTQQSINAGAADVANVPSTATNDNGAEPPPQLVLGTTKFDMTLWLRESGGAIKVRWSTTLTCSARSGQRLVGHYKQLLTAIVNNPQQRVSELPLLTETEQQLLQGFNDTARALPQAELCAHQLFEEQVARTPEAVALIAEDEQLSYAELNGRANQLALSAQQRRGRGNGGRRLSATRCQSASGAAGSAQERRCLPAAGARLPQPSGWQR